MQPIPHEVQKKWASLPSHAGMPILVDFAAALKPNALRGNILLVDMAWYWLEHQWLQWEQLEMSQSFGDLAAFKSGSWLESQRQGACIPMTTIEQSHLGGSLDRLLMDRL